MTYDDVTEDMNAILAANPITKERLRCIPNTNTYANSVNVYVGRPRSGKTYLALHDIISVIRNDETAHLMVYINESGQCDVRFCVRVKECPLGHTLLCLFCSLGHK